MTIQVGYRPFINPARFGKQNPASVSSSGSSLRFGGMTNPRELDEHYQQLNTPEERMAFVQRILSAEYSPFHPGAATNWATARFLQLMFTEGPDVWATALVDLLNGQNTRTDTRGPAQQYIALNIIRGMHHVLENLTYVQERNASPEGLAYRMGYTNWHPSIAYGPYDSHVLRAVQLMKDDNQSFARVPFNALLRMTPLCERLYRHCNLVIPATREAVAMAARVTERTFLSERPLRRFGEYEMIQTENGPRALIVSNILQARIQGRDEYIPQIVEMGLPELRALSLHMGGKTAAAQRVDRALKELQAQMFASAH